MKSFRLRSLYTLASALKDYKKRGKTVTEFESDYDCKVNYDQGGNIFGISCNNDSSKTMMKLKYE